MMNIYIYIYIYIEACRQHRFPSLSLSLSLSLSFFLSLSLSIPFGKSLLVSPLDGIKSLYSVMMNVIVAFSLILVCPCVEVHCKKIFMRSFLLLQKSSARLLGMVCWMGGKWRCHRLVGCCFGICSKKHAPRFFFFLLSRRFVKVPVVQPYNRFGLVGLVLRYVNLCRRYLEDYTDSDPCDLNTDL